MLPGSVSGALLILALIPGWAYLRLQERLRPPRTATGLSELLEVVAVGLATTGISAVVVILIPHDRAPFFVDLNSWAISADRYLRLHPRNAIVTAGAVLVLALMLAYAAYRIQRLRLPTEFSPNTVWAHALGARPRGKVPWVGLQLTDGRLVEGVLHSYTLDQVDVARDVALSHPIRVTANAGDQPLVTELDRLVVPEKSIVYIAVNHVAEAGGSSREGADHIWKPGGRYR